MSDKYAATFDAAKLVDALGGVGPAHDALTMTGCDIQLKSIQRWLQRGSMPKEAVASIAMAYRNKFKCDLDLTDFIVGEN